MPLETDKSGGLKLSLDQEIGTGLWPNMFARKTPLWRTGQNIIFTPIGVKKLPGWTQVAATGNAEPIRGMVQSIEGAAADEAILYCGDLTKLYKVDLETGTVTVLGTGYNLSSDAGASVWDGGTTTWDGGASLWDFGIVRGDHWSMVTFGTWQLATSGADYPQIRKGYGDFVSMYRGVTGVTLTAAGTGYLVGDTISASGGDGTGATAEVLTVGGSGEILTIGMTSAGTGYTTAPTGYTGGTGTGATFSWTICDIDVVSVDIFLNRGPHVLGFNTSVSGKEFIWCDADDPDTWVAASNNLAGQLEIRELKSEIVAAVPLGSRIAVYGDDQMFVVNYLANDLVFGYEPALNGIGAVSKKAVVPVDRKNYGMSQQGFFVTDGASFQYIDEPAVRAYFVENANQAQLSKTIAFHDEENTQVRWYFPTSGSTNTGGLSFNYKTNTWSILLAERSSGDERRVVAGPLSTSETGVIYIENQGQNNDGVSMEAWVRTKPMDFNNADLIKELDSIRIGYVGSGLTYRIGWSETEDGTITWGSYTAMSEGFDFDNLRVAGRWLHMELYSNSLNAAWEVASIELIGRSEGTR